jgi:DNA repair protein RAD16
MITRNRRSSASIKKTIIESDISEESGSEYGGSDAASTIEALSDASTPEETIEVQKGTNTKRLVVDNSDSDALAPRPLIMEIDSSSVPSSSRISKPKSKTLGKKKRKEIVIHSDDELVTSASLTAKTEDEDGTTPKKKRQPKKPKVTKPIFEDLHPELSGFWNRLGKSLDSQKVDRAEQPCNVLCQLLPFQLEGLAWMKSQESSKYRGGILADEVFLQLIQMGMGKTIQTISLILSKKTSKPCLVLCPTVAMMQWYSELTTKTTPGMLTVILYHGAKRETNKSVLDNADVVISSYAILEQSYRKQVYGTKSKGELVKKPSLIHSVKWGRVILDEAHAIKDRYCSTAKATFSLDSDFKWSLSGTPMQNRIGELFSLIRFMNLYPYSYYFCTMCDCKSQNWQFTHSSKCDSCGHTGHQHFNWWNKEVLKPIQRYGTDGPGQEAFQKLGLILDQIMLRRTKVERNDELGLPPRIVECRSDIFNFAEEELYESLYSNIQRTYQTYAESGTVLNNYASIFSLLSRMRLAANHPDLVTSKITPGDSKFVCVICNEEAEDPITSKCKHVFCREDARQYLQTIPAGENAKCPKCMRDLVIDITQPESTNANAPTVQKSIINYLDLKSWRSSTKIEALVEELTKLKSENATTKSIVFSQFVSFLDLVHWRLSRSGFNCVKLDGRMGPQQRSTVIEKFSTDPSITIFLISLKAGGIALNLTEASRVFGNFNLIQ